MSLGTGIYKKRYAPRVLRNWGALAWIWPRGSEPALMRAMVDGQTASADVWAHMILNHEPGDPLPTRADVGHGPRYFRIEPNLDTDVEMDDSRQNTLDGLTMAACTLIEQRRHELQAIAERLSATGLVSSD